MVCTILRTKCRQVNVIHGPLLFKRLILILSNTWPNSTQLVYVDFQNHAIINILPKIFLNKKLLSILIYLVESTLFKHINCRQYFYKRIKTSQLPIRQSPKAKKQYRTYQTQRDLYHSLRRKFSITAYRGYSAISRLMLEITMLD